MKRTLLDDLLQVYYSIPCDEIENAYCSSCSCCKNKMFCNMVMNLIDSIVEFYGDDVE